jgi:hypothetical protein
VRLRLALLSALALVVVLTAGAQAYQYTEVHFVTEPWSGWWWPMYHDPLDTT